MSEKRISYFLTDKLIIKLIIDILLSLMSLISKCAVIFMPALDYFVCKFKLIFHIFIYVTHKQNPLAHQPDSH